MTARSWIRHLFARTIRKEPHARRGTPTRLRHEQLESRDCPAVAFVNDYSLDTNNFFTPARRTLVEFAERQLSTFLNDNLTAITPDPANGNTVTFTFDNTLLNLDNRNRQVNIENPTIPADTIQVYLWGLPDSRFRLPGTLATCGPAVENIGPASSQPFRDTVLGRGQDGALATPATDTSCAVVRMDVNQDATYYESTNPPPPNAPNDFVTLIEHELMHPLGFLGANPDGTGGNPATLRLLNAEGQFTGPAVRELMGGPVSMVVPTADGGFDIGSHWAPGTTVSQAGNQQPALMNPAIQNGRISPLDIAFLRDVGWDTGPLPQVIPQNPQNPGPNNPSPNNPVDPGGDPAGGVTGRFGAGADTGGGVAQMTNPNGTPLFTLTPFGNFTGGIRTASADFNLDGIPDLVVGTGPGGPTRVQVIDGRTQAVLFDVHPFEAAFTGGVYVAAGDLNRDGRAELIITPDQGGGPRVQIYNGAGFAKMADFFGIDDPNFRGGARPAIGDINGDGRPDLIVAAGFGGGPRVTVWANADVLSGNIPNSNPLVNRFVFEDTLRNGAFVAAGDVNNDGSADLICGGGPGGGPRVFILDGRALTAGTETVLGNFFGGDVNSRGGIRVASKDLNGDGRFDVIVGAGEGAGSQVTAYDAATINPNGAPPSRFQFDLGAGLTGGVFVG
jgi:hypothetical protein